MTDQPVASEKEMTISMNICACMNSLTWINMHTISMQTDLKVFFLFLFSFHSTDYTLVYKYGTDIERTRQD
jgi:hypothetical protein